MEECVEFEGARYPFGYGRVRISGRSVGAHRVAYCEAHGLSLKDIEGKVVRHKCDNPPCINPEHLLLGTHADNMRDKVERNRLVMPDTKGVSHWCCKLSVADVAEIRKRYVPRCPINGANALAREFGVVHSTISKIVNFQKWKHIA